MRPLAFLARKRIGYEGFGEKRVQNSIYRMVQNPVADWSFMNMPAFRVINKEALVFAVLINLAFQIFVELPKIVH